MTSDRPARTSKVPPAAEASDPHSGGSLMSRLDAPPEERPSDHPSDPASPRRPSAAELLGGRGRRKRASRAPDAAAGTASPLTPSSPPSSRPSGPPSRPPLPRASAPDSIVGSTLPSGSGFPEPIAAERPRVSVTSTISIGASNDTPAEPSPIPIPTPLEAETPRTAPASPTASAGAPPLSRYDAPTPHPPPSQPRRAAVADAPGDHPTVRNLDATVREALALLDRDDFEPSSTADVDISIGLDEPVALPAPAERVSTLPLGEESIDEVEEVLPTRSVPPPSNRRPPPPKGRPPIPAIGASSDPNFRAVVSSSFPPPSVRTSSSSNRPLAAVQSEPAIPLIVAAAHATATDPSSAVVTGSPDASAAPIGPQIAPDTGGEIRRKKRQWFEDLFNDDYLRTSPKTPPAFVEREVRFIEDALGCDRGAAILDLGCGPGHHAVSLAERGYEVIGIDLSLAMLARASDEATEKNQRINFVQGDMRDLAYEEAFDGVYCWGTTFGYFDDAKNAEVVSKIHKALRRRGRFLLDVVNRDYVIGKAPSMVWFEAEGCVCMDEMAFNSISSRLQVKRTMMMEDGRQREIDYSIRLYALHELGKLLHEQGFRVVEASGDTTTPAVYFGAESPRVIILAEKR